MAKKTPRPARTLLVFLIVVAAMYALVAFTSPPTKDASRWKPQLGLDLEGGTRITLTAAGSPTDAQLREARGIIDKRVNGSGVTEADVSTQGGRNIVVEIPGKNATNLIDSVKRTAQLRFRLVATGSPQPGTPLPTGSPSASPSAGAPSSGSPSSSPSAAATPSGGAEVGSASPTATPKPRAAAGGLDQPAAKATPSATPSAPSAPSASASKSPGGFNPSVNPAAPSASPSAGAGTPAGTTPGGAAINDPLAWRNSPDTASLAKFAAYTCPTGNAAQTAVADVPAQPLVTCDDKGNKFLLSQTVIEGTSLKSASYGATTQGVGWQVNLALKGKAVKTFGDISTALIADGGQFAVVLDGRVISYAGFNGTILDGNAQITGGFTQGQAKSLANSLKYGALPLKFLEPTSELIGPSLAGDQLSAGVYAGIVGLLVVMLYCLLYYRGLGLVVIASLIVAATVTYAMVLLLAKTAGFTLTLPGIAGLIVAVGITADSFIVYFERIRDEMRTGKSMRVAVELGWARARNTCLAADAVSLLAAVVLYIFTIGVVKGFAFALGISTLIDLAVFFWFTKPSMTALARVAFFSSGSRFSGLSRETLGIDGPASARPGTVGGRA